LLLLDPQLPRCHGADIHLRLGADLVLDVVGYDGAVFQPPEKDVAIEK